MGGPIRRLTTSWRRRSVRAATPSAPRAPDFAHDIRGATGLALRLRLHEQIRGKRPAGRRKARSPGFAGPREIDSKEKVHRLLTDVRFYDESFSSVEWLLKYEYDSILCANSAQLAVEDHYIPNAMGFHVGDGGHGLSDLV